MPFDLSSLTSEQCIRFVDRLATHLQPPESRSRLMAVREAFAKTAGFPDAHAAERATPDAPFSRVLGWAGQAWKSHRPLLSAEPFGQEQSEKLMAAVWGYPSWGDIITTLALREVQPSNWVHEVSGAEPPAVWVGKADRGQVGLTEQAWNKHVLVIDEETKRRRALVLDWARQRAAQGDRVLLMDGTAKGVSSEELRLPGLEVSHWDWRQGVECMPRLSSLSSSPLMEVIWAGVLKTAPAPIGQGLSPDWAISWGLDVAKAFNALPLAERTTLALRDLLADDETIGKEHQEHWLKVFGEPREVERGQGGQIEIIRLPSLEEEGFAPEQAYRIALASAWVIAEIYEKFPSNREKPRTTILWLDVPLWARTPGFAVVYAQARSLGISLVEAGPARILSDQGVENMGSLAKSSVANLGTKFFGEVDSDTPAAVLGWLPSKSNRVKPRSGQMVGVAGSQVVKFTPLFLSTPIKPRTGTP